MTDKPGAKPPFLSRWLPVFLVWLGARSVYFAYLGSADADYRVAAEAGFGPALWGAEVFFAFLATGAAVGMWLRWRQTVPLAIAALALYASITVFQLMQMERDPGRARRAYVASREARGLTVPEERLDQMFSPSGRKVTWLLGGLFALAPLAILLWRRVDFEPQDDELRSRS